MLGIFIQISDVFGNVNVVGEGYTLAVKFVLLLVYLDNAGQGLAIDVLIVVKNHVDSLVNCADSRRMECLVCFISAIS